MFRSKLLSRKSQQDKELTFGTGCDNWKPPPKKSGFSRLKDRLFGPRSKQKRDAAGTGNSFDPPRYSCDGAIYEHSKSVPKEPPRRSLDSRILVRVHTKEPPRRSLDVSLLRQDGKPKQSKSNIVATLMGLPQLDENPSVQTLEDLLHGRSRNHVLLPPSPERDDDSDASFQRVVERLKRLQLEKKDSVKGSKVGPDSDMKPTIKLLHPMVPNKEEDKEQFKSILKEPPRRSVDSRILPCVRTEEPPRRSFDVSLLRRDGQLNKTPLEDKESINTLPPRSFYASVRKPHKTPQESISTLVTDAEPEKGQPKTIRADIKTKKLNSKVAAKTSGNFIRAPAAKEKHKVHDFKPVCSSLMKPTVSSSARQQEQVARQPIDAKKIRDRTESRAALLNLKTVSNTKLANKCRDIGGNSHEKIEKETSQEIISTQSCAFHAERKTEPSRDDHCSKGYENLSPVSVLEVVTSYDDGEKEQLPVTNVELDKVRTNAQQIQHRKLRLFNSTLLCYIKDDEQEVCTEHWSKEEQCRRCRAEICLQVDRAIYDDLVYEAIIQLNVQHIKLANYL